MRDGGSVYSHFTQNYLLSVYQNVLNQLTLRQDDFKVKVTSITARKGVWKVTGVTAILVADFDTFVCSNCGGGTRIDAVMHNLDVPGGRTPTKPCGAVFDRFALTQASPTRIRTFQRRRPDLEFVGMGIVEGYGAEAHFVQPI